jgi:prepilin-type N-terminal cleavage/methylation domain-containing protein
MNRSDWKKAIRPRRPIRERATPNAPLRLRGFSLVEILVVLGIIAFLTAAIVVVMPRLGNASKIAATQATIKKVDELLNDRINGFNRWINTQNTLAGNNAPSYVVSSPFAGVYTQNPLLYKLLATKYAFRTAFPQNFQEATNLPAYNTSAHQQVTESAALLYLILTQAAVFDTEPPAAADLKGVEVADTDHDGLMEIVDAWGQPLRYYRWPTRLFRPVPPGGAVTTPGWNNLGQGPAPTPASLLVRSMPRLPLFQWTKNTTYAAGQFIQPANVPQGPPGDVMMYQAGVTGTSGTSGGTEPTWSSATAVGAQTAADGNITWTAALDPLTVDSDDPNGIVSISLINESGAATFHTWATYHVPLIVSCGTDGALGLYEPYDTTNFGTLAQPQFASSSAFNLDALTDNLTNHQQ